MFGVFSFWNLFLSYCILLFMSKYIPTIGLEIHAELNTKTKMFCSSLNDPEEKRPNINVCPVCMAHPGTLPVINKEAVRHVLRVGYAIGAKIADFTEFDRKNYFYPDLPKGYQISQYKYPLVSGGQINEVQITRIHLEEDAAKNFHDPESGKSLIDFNRAGLPLMELVTEPVIHDAKVASGFAKELQLLLRYLGASEANMEKGQMRVEANISVSPDSDKLGTKTEVKNINSFRSVERAIEYEINRQIEILESGERVVQETRGWDDNRQVTFSQRIKGNADDYRYFPEPDLPKLWLSKVEDFRDLENTLPELPWQKRNRLINDFGIKSEDAEAYVVSKEFSDLFEAVAGAFPGNKDLVKLSSNYITSDLVGLSKDNQLDFEYLKANFPELMKLVSAGEISSRGAKDILAVMIKEGGKPKELAEKLGLFQKSDEGELKSIVEKIISENEKVVADFKAGKEASLQFLIGQGMKATKGSANPAILKKMFLELVG